MKHKKLKLSVLLLGLGLTTQAQQASTATGGDASGSGGSVAYSVGQVAYITSTGPTGSVAQGVEQPYEIFILSTNEVVATDISISVFPNPTSDNLILQVGDFTTNKLSYQLLDIRGRLLANDIITANQTQLSLANLPQAAYFVNVTQQNKKVKAFKILKN